MTDAFLFSQIRSRAVSRSAEQKHVVNTKAVEGVMVKVGLLSYCINPILLRDAEPIEISTNSSAGNEIGSITSTKAFTPAFFIAR